MKRLNFLFIIISLILLTLLLRVYFLSIKSNTYYEELSKNNYIKRVYTIPNRGIISDRNGKPLAMNKLGFSINIKPHLQSVRKRALLESLISLINKHFPEYTKEELLKKYKKLDSPYKHDFVKIVDYIPYEVFFEKYTLFNSLDTIKIESEVKRIYPYKENAVHIIGYVGKATRLDINNNPFSKHSDIIGKMGLEKYYNNHLQGELGYKDIKVNALNKELEVLDEKEVSSNNDLRISLDIELQKYVKDIFHHKSGSVIVMDTKTGEILVAASYPEFDANIFVDGISVTDWNKMINDFNHPFTNKLINGMYPPGSIIKMGVALSFLENGIKPNYTVYDSGSLTLGKRKFRCWKHEGHGIVGFRKAIRESCDDFFYKGSLVVGINKISKTLRKFGIGEKTGIDLNNEHYGTNPNKTWKENKYHEPWYIGETVITSIGQGQMLVTPMQIARYTAFLATGKLPKPHFSDLNYEEPLDVDFNQKDMNIVRQGMYDVMNHEKGTGSHYTKNLKIKIAGKTGTAQVISIPQSEKKRMKESELEYYHRSHAWLTTYGPYKNPQYVVTVLVEHGGHGGSAAGEIVTKIYNKLLDLGYIKKN
ncbi:MAG: penicillin-binding protein 2 [Halarcobacter sp.]